MARPFCEDCATRRPSVVEGGNTADTDCPGRSERSRPRNFSTDPEANTRRNSRLKIKTASSRSCSRWSMLPRRSETSYCAPRRRSPRRLTLDAITESSSLAAEKFLDRPGGQNQAKFPIEDKNGVFQVLQQVVDVAVFI